MKLLSPVIRDHSQWTVLHKRVDSGKITAKNSQKKNARKNGRKNKNNSNKKLKKSGIIRILSRKS